MATTFGRMASLRHLLRLRLLVPVLAPSTTSAKSAPGGGPVFEIAMATTFGRVASLRHILRLRLHVPVLAPSLFAKSAPGICQSEHRAHHEHVSPDTDGDSHVIESSISITVRLIVTHGINRGLKRLCRQTTTATYVHLVVTDGGQEIVALGHV